MKKLILTCTFLLVSLYSATAAGETKTYVFLPDQSTVLQTGGFMGIHETHTVTGRFQLTVDFETGAASFEQVDATLTESPFLHTQSLDVLFNMTELAGTIISDTQINFVGQTAETYPVDVNLVVTLRDNSVEITGGTFPPCCDFFIFNLDAVAYEFPQTYYVDAVNGDDNNDGLSPETAFATIQKGIDTARDSDTIIVYPGLYTENINFLGKNLTLKSTKPTDPNIVARTVLDGGASGSVVTFDGTESSECILRGFTITGGREVSGGGIYGNRTMATIEHNLIIGNTATGGINWDGKGGGIYACDGIIRNNIIANNLALYQGGGIFALDGIIQNNLIYGNCAHITGGGGIYSRDNYPSYSSCPIIKNCTIVNNTTGMYCTGNDGQGGGIYCSKGNHHIITNCILWGNVADHGPEIALIDYSIDPIEPEVSLTITYSDVQGGQAMVYTHGYYDLIWGGGNIDDDPCFADLNNGDYHLKSQAGRWDPNSESWVKDDLTSPCIDAGDHMSPIGLEPFPNGGLINMGAYSGTAEASKSYFGKPVCETIVAGDVNGDCRINFLDFRFMALHWLEDNTPPLPQP